MTTTQSFAECCEGAKMTFVFGNGIHAITGVVTEIGADWVRVDAEPRNPPTGRALNVENEDVMIPLHAIVYARYSDG